MEGNGPPSGDSNKCTEVISTIEENSTRVDCFSPNNVAFATSDQKNDEINSKNIEDKEFKLKERIEHCKHVIASLKLELNEEKSKLEREAKCNHSQQNKAPTALYVHEKEFMNEEPEDMLTSNIYAASVDSKLTCDENLMEYEKQLQRYQNTLNMAQIEKKNAIRKQMLGKVYKLKLLEVENQCNIELLRIKQSLQCLEPLQMIVEKWKTSTNGNLYDLNNLELIPRYPELNPSSDSDVITNSNSGDV